jgi:hypothetical protein
LGAARLTGLNPKEFLSQSSQVGASARRIVVTAGFHSGRVPMSATRRLTQQPFARDNSDRPRPVHCSFSTASCAHGCDTGLETSRSDRGHQLQLATVVWVRCLRPVRVSTRQGQRLDRSTFSDCASADVTT